MIFYVYRYNLIDMQITVIMIICFMKLNMFIYCMMLFRTIAIIKENKRCESPLQM